MSEATAETLRETSESSLDTGALVWVAAILKRAEDAAKGGRFRIRVTDEWLSDDRFSAAVADGLRAKGMNVVFRNEQREPRGLSMFGDWQTVMHVDWSAPPEEKSDV